MPNRRQFIFQDVSIFQLLQVFPFDNFLVDNTYYMIYVGLMGDLR